VQGKMIFSKAANRNKYQLVKMNIWPMLDTLVYHNLISNQQLTIRKKWTKL
jgi:hypothetical protein